MASKTSSTEVTQQKKVFVKSEKALQEMEANGQLEPFTEYYTPDEDDTSDTIPAIIFAESERQKSRNLFDFLNYIDVNGNFTILDNGIKGIVDENTSSRFMVYELYLEKGTYTVSANCKFTTTNTGHYPTIGLKLDGDTDNLIRCNSSYDVDTRYSASFTVNTAQTIEIILYMSNAAAQMLIGDTAEFTDIMMTTDGTTDYQPYHGEIIHKKDLEDVHPVGSYHICKTGSADPAYLFGGHWTQIATNVVIPLGGTVSGTAGEQYMITSNTNGSISCTFYISAGSGVLNYLKIYNKDGFTGSDSGGTLSRAYTVMDLSTTSQKLEGVDIWLREEPEYENL